MFTNNQINVKKDGRQSWDDSGRDNKDSEAGIWMVETLRRRQKIGLTKRGKVNIKKVRREMLAGYIWREESFRVEMEKEERGKRMKKTKTKEAETDEEDKEEPEEMEATQATWELNIQPKEQKIQRLEKWDSTREQSPAVEKDE